MTNLVEQYLEDIQCVNESVGSDGKKFWYIEGIFAQANKVNKNQRIYPKDVLKESMDSYIAETVSRNKAVGELSHPANTTINPDRASHLILSLKEDGDNFHGKARVLNTPCGKIVQGLLEGGVNIGVSTRAEGKVKLNSKGINEVERGLKMTTVDIVLNPSGPDCWVDPIMESEIPWDESDPDSIFVRTLQEEIHKTKARNLQEAKLKALQKFFNHLKG